MGCCFMTLAGKNHYRWTSVFEGNVYTWQHFLSPPHSLPILFQENWFVGLLSMGNWAKIGRGDKHFERPVSPFEYIHFPYECAYFFIRSSQKTVENTSRNHNYFKSHFFLYGFTIFQDQVKNYKLSQPGGRLKIKHPKVQVSMYP